MEKPSLKELLQNPANVVLVLIFLISIVVGSLFMVRVFYHEDDNSVVAMKEIDDHNVYYVSYDASDSEGKKAPYIALIYDDKNHFNLITSNDKNVGYTGDIVFKDNNVYLYADKYYSSKIRSDYKLFTLYIDENKDLVLQNNLNNVESYKLKKCESKNLKSAGFKSTSSFVNNIPSYTYEDNDKETILNGVYNLNSLYSVLKFVDRIGNEVVTSADANISRDSSVFNGQYINRRSLNQFYLLELLLPNIPNADYSKTMISGLSNNIFRTDLNYNNLYNFKYNGKPYGFNDDRLNVLSNNTENVNSNYIRRIYNYDSYDNKLTIYEYLISYECNGGTCKYYPFININEDEKEYYDFESSSIDLHTVLTNANKLKSYVWTFSSDDSGNYYFESLEYK